MAEHLQKNGIVHEFADPDYLVMMITPENGDGVFERIFDALTSLERREPITAAPPKLVIPEKILSVREAVFGESELLPVRECEGRIMAEVSVGCPPAVPIAVSGERIDRSLIECFEYYGIEKCYVAR